MRLVLISLLFSFLALSVNAQVTLEAETAELFGGTIAQGDAVGNFHIGGAGVNFQFNAPEEGWYAITFHAAAPNFGTMHLEINTVGQGLQFFPKTGSWSSTDTTTRVVRLSQGANTITIANRGWYCDAINLDKIFVRSALEAEIPHPSCIAQNETIQKSQPLVDYAEIVNQGRKYARSAWQFRNSIGVGVGVHTSDNAKYESAIFPLLVSSGIRHVRISGERQDSTTVARMNWLHKSAGIMFNPIFDPRAVYPSEVPPYVAQNRHLFASIECSNEPDISGIPKWEELTCWFVKSLHDHIRSHPDLKDIPIIGPSMTSKDAWNAVGDLSPWVDYSAMHDYTRDPGNGGWGDDGYGSLQWNITVARSYSPSKPVIATETGYSVHEGKLSEEMKTIFLPRLLLEHFNWGVKRTYIYRFEDPYQGTDREANFGLVDYAGNPKPSYFAVSRLSNAFKNADSTAVPDSVTLWLSGQTERVHYSLFKEREQRYILALWVERNGWHWDNYHRISVAPQDVSIHFGKPIKSITANYPLKDTIWNEIAANTETLSLAISDSVVLVRYDDSQSTSPLSGLVSHLPLSPLSASIHRNALVISSTRAFTNATVTLLDLHGKRIFACSLDEVRPGKCIIPLGRTAPGVHVLRISDNARTYFLKVR